MEKVKFLMSFLRSFHFVHQYIWSLSSSLFLYQFSYGATLVSITDYILCALILPMLGKSSFWPRPQTELKVEGI